MAGWLERLIGYPVVYAPLSLPSSSRMAEKKPLFSPASTPGAGDAPFPCIVLASKVVLSLTHWRTSCLGSLGWAGEKSYTSGAFIGCGLRDGLV